MKANKKKYLKYILIDLIVGGVLFGLLYLYTPNWPYIQDLFYIVAILLFTVGWLIYVSNQGIFDVAIYGVGQFLRAIIGKKQEKTFIEYRAEKELVDKMVFLMMWLVAGIFLVVGLIFNFLV